MTFTIREAVANDHDTIFGLLEDADLVTNDILVPGSRYWLAVAENGAVIGVIGAEYGTDSALMRSVLVTPEHRGEGIGAALVQTLFVSCRASGHHRIYCFSTDAGAYWLKTGFVEVPVSEIEAALPDAPQVADFDRRGWLPTEIAYRLDL